MTIYYNLSKKDTDNRRFIINKILSSIFYQNDSTSVCVILESRNFAFVTISFLENESLRNLYEHVS